MKDTSLYQKVSQRETNKNEQLVSAGPQAIAVTPPAYGIESIDNPPEETAPEPQPELPLGASIQKKAAPSTSGSDAGLKPTLQRNRTGLPDALKGGIESLSGLALDDVRVHYNSSKPAALQALAYAQGTDIHLGPGQERHLPHETWHVVQQKQGRVQPTMQMKGGISVNDNIGLEHEADVMGAKALRPVRSNPARVSYSHIFAHQAAQAKKATAPVVQRALAQDLVSTAITTAIAGEHHSEIPQAAEKRKWGAIGVNVVYEDESLTVSGAKPDAPILRAAYLWSFFYTPADELWRSVLRGDDVTANQVSMDNHRETAARLKDELEEVGLGIDRNLDRAYSLLDALVTALPTDNAALMALPWANREYLARAKRNLLEELQGLMYNVHRGGSFADVSFEAQSLMEERSLHMLRTVESARVTKTIYKVGDEHVEDIQRLKLKHDPKVAVLSRTEYLAEYADLDTFESVGNQNVFHQIGNESL